MTELLTYTIVAFATWQAIEIWHHGKIFAETNARLESCENWFADLMLCPFCLSVWVAALLWLWSLGSAALADFSPIWAAVSRLPIDALAISRAANLANDAFYRVTRTPAGSGYEVKESLRKTTNSHDESEQ